jgi:RNA 2'-O ribose methyltransferase substrate binding
VAPVLAALSAGRRTPHALLLQDGMSPAARKDARALSEVQRLARQQGVAIRSASKHELNMLTGSRYASTHTGV